MLSSLQKLKSSPQLFKNYWRGIFAGFSLAALLLVSVVEPCYHLGHDPVAFLGSKTFALFIQKERWGVNHFLETI